MASEYLKQKYRDVKPDEPVTYTRKEKAANWWHYHKWYVLGGVAAVAILASIVCSMLGIGKTEPDFFIAYVGASALPEQTVDALEQAFAAAAPDSNGDGETVVKLNQYVDPGVDAENAYTYASTATILADLERGESYFFLLDDPALFQEKYRVLAGRDGEPTEDDPDVRPLSSCPALRGLDAEQEDAVTRFYLARRAFREENAPDNLADCEALWAALTESPAP